MLKENNICFKEISSFSRLISYATFYGLLLKLFVSGASETKDLSNKPASK